MQCRSCRFETTDETLKSCPECGFEFNDNNNISNDLFINIDKFIAAEGLAFQELLSHKPLITFLAERDEVLFLVTQKDQKYINIYHALEEKAGRFFPSLSKVGDEYCIFNWDGLNQKLSEWITEKSDTNERLKLWYKIAEFINICHENDILVNNFNPDNIWVNKEDNPIFQDIEFFSYKDESNIVVYNEGFSSPEIKGGMWDKVDFQSDIYGMARLYIYMYKSCTKKDMADINDITDIIKKLPLNVGFSILKALTDDIDYRWKNLGEFMTKITNVKIPNICIYGLSETGFREINEDSICYSQKRVQSHEGDFNLSCMIVADGMGGLDCGEVASSFVVKKLREELEFKTKEYLMSSKASIDQNEVIKIIRELIEECNFKLIEEKEEIGKNLGTTVVVCIVIDTLLHVGYVGDSRVYIFDKNGKIKYVTEDHSLVGKREAEGDITEEEAMVDPNKNIIYQAIGLKKAIRVDTKTMVLEEGDNILLCSDGICGCFLRRDLEVIMSNPAPINETAVKLCYTAFERGSTDNCSLILAQLI